MNAEDIAKLILITGVVIVSVRFCFYLMKSFFE